MYFLNALFTSAWCKEYCVEAHRSDTILLNQELLFVVCFPGVTNHCGFCILQPSGGAIASLRTRFLDHTQRRATVGRTPLDE